MARKSWEDPVRRFLSRLLIGIGLLALTAPAWAQRTTMTMVGAADCKATSCTAASAPFCTDSASGLLHRCNVGSGFYAPVPVAPAKMLEVSPSGAQYTVICGATCNSATSDCVAGSALKAIKDAGTFSESNPYQVLVHPGTYNECIAFNDLTDVTLRLAEGARIVPTVAGPTDVQGGVVRIANNTTAKVQRISITGAGYVRNDAFNPPEAAIQIGPESCSGTTKWDLISVIGGTWIGNHDSIQ